jgi:toxin-antitoxin system PIN domain toxin
MSRNEKIDLLDTSVWVAMSTPEHPMRPAAASYWIADAAPVIAFSRMTMLGLVRLLTNRTHLGGKPLSFEEAWEVYRAWGSQSAINVHFEPEGCEGVLSGWIDQRIVSQRTFPDAYLAAFALSGNMRLVTFDRDFARFPGLDHLILGN